MDALDAAAEMSNEQDAARQVDLLQGESTLFSPCLVMTKTGGAQRLGQLSQLSCAKAIFGFGCPDVSMLSHAVIWLELVPFDQSLKRKAIPCAFNLFDLLLSFLSNIGLVVFSFCAWVGFFCDE